MKTLLKMEGKKVSNNMNHDLETKLIHWGHKPDPTTGALASPNISNGYFCSKFSRTF